jgi:hypothetical protein
MCPPKSSVFGGAGIGVLSGMLIDSFKPAASQSSNPTSQSTNGASKVVKVIAYVVGIVFGIPLFVAGLWCYKWYALPVIVPGLIIGTIMYRAFNRKTLVDASPAMQVRLGLPGIQAGPIPALPRAIRKELTRERRAIAAPTVMLEATVISPVPVPATRKG